MHTDQNPEMVTYKMLVALAAVWKDLGTTHSQYPLLRHSILHLEDTLPMFAMELAISLLRLATAAESHL